MQHIFSGLKEIRMKQFKTEGTNQKLDDFCMNQSESRQFLGVDGVDVDHLDSSCTVTPLLLAARMKNKQNARKIASLNTIKSCNAYV